MPFVKVVKNKQYFKRFQVKYRRRREGKTDYRARKRLICQDKNKYNSPKYRLVVRFTNKQVICQIVYSLIDGDKVLCAAYSSELKRYGLTVGLKNYAAAYCTGLLVARRLLQKLGLDEVYEGNDEIDGNVVSTEMNGTKYFVAEVDDEKRPFHALLDVGITTTTTGNRVFGALKGAADGGLDIPHSEKRFPGYDRDAKSYDAEVHADRIKGAHVAEYMSYLQEEDPDMYKAQFSKYIEAGVTTDDVEELMEKVHEAIREDPSPAEKKEHTFDKKFRNRQRCSYQQRKARIKQIKEAAARKAAAEEEEG
jgi:large subunit ribosomal protein L5e|mmetsp:Transcript_19052/g.27486  ORF Transcript_19052/g.27486 Transcript_19052/m.27486 type:complete len:308 (-) Transcript_19052:127-1050(-)|eukprot:CAMPEP_0113936550 /NCGR_PEP_ID=MMETSP1339-20121228/3428_1 /TAXON_ID=94617 /ORGANISM="Fibrocapsa japonica" /LENGTH=307 /DNA_ID=CAMNT_0000939069 /DNA_START=88 /DNA_END=1011 /DNA_ORIENTATION=- /assembly_acc=CAM_ASM_000762